MTYQPEPTQPPAGGSGVSRPATPQRRTSGSRLRFELASVLGPGNDDATAYAQADAVLEVLDGYTYLEIQAAIEELA